MGLNGRARCGSKESLNKFPTASFISTRPARIESLPGRERSPALQIIATDLTAADGGEWPFFKQWRNALEHGALILQPEGAMDGWESCKEKPGVILVREQDFVYRLENLPRLTRSAIFSFVYFLVRDRGLRVKE